MKRPLGALVVVSLLTLTFLGSMIPVVSATTYDCTLSCPVPYAKPMQFVMLKGTYKEDGVGIGGASIGIYEDKIVNGNPQRDYLISATTLANGDYSVLVLMQSAGDHKLIAGDYQDPSTSRFYSNYVTVHVGTFPLSFEASPNPVIVGDTLAFSGQLTDSSGNGIGSQDVGIWELIPVGSDIQTVFVCDATTDASGNYETSINTLALGSHTLKASVGNTPDSTNWACSDPVTVNVVNAPDHKQDAIDAATTLINDPAITTATFLSKNNHKPFDSKLQEASDAVRSAGAAAAPRVHSGEPHQIGCHRPGATTSGP